MSDQPKPTGEGMPGGYGKPWRVPTGECNHDLAERETMCADGWCTICLQAALHDAYNAALAEAKSGGWLSQEALDEYAKVEAEHRELREQLSTEREKVDRDALSVTVAFNRMRSAMVALDNLLHAQHNRRHPVPRPVLDLTPTQPLDPETRAKIDATP